jgi:putative FmdB family regulatory protein
MPIYEYRCTSCGFEQEYLRKVNATPLTECPQCGKPTFAKQLSAAGFQLKGSGWYATDFKNNGSKAKDSKPDSKPETNSDTKPDSKPETKTDTKTETKSDTKTASKPPSTSSSSGGSTTS